MNRVRELRQDARGAAALEFALVAPLFLLLLIGILQMGIGFYANAGLRSGVEAAARYAQICPRPECITCHPSDTQISAMMTSNAFGLNPSFLVGPTVTHGIANGQKYVDISATYRYPLKIIFMNNGPINISYTRRAYQI